VNTKTITSLLLGFYRAAAFAGQRESMLGLETRALRKADVFTLQRSAGVRLVEVQNGSIWLTGQGGPDVLLRSGGRFDLGNQWPYVIEALDEARINLR
jgi:hypothetical protein